MDPNGTDDGYKLSRRTVLKITAGGAIMIGASSTITAQEQTFELGGEIPGWVGQAPEEIAGETNPTLQVIAGEEYEVIWENLDGAGHNFAIEDEAGDIVQSSEIVSGTGSTQTVTFTAQEDFAEYFCQPHPSTMRGDFEVIDEEPEPEPEPETHMLTVTVEDEDGNPVVATVMVEDMEQETTEEEPTVTYELADGDYTIVVTAEGYADVEEDVTIDGADEEITVTMVEEEAPPDARELTVRVQTEEEQPIAEADVTVDDEEAATDEDGVATLDLEDGNYTVTVSAGGYEDAEEEVTIDGEDVEVTVMLTPVPVDAELLFSDQTRDGTFVCVDFVDLADGGFVSAQEPTAPARAADEQGDRDLGDFFEMTVLGVSEFLEPGAHENVRIDLDQPLEEDMRLIAMTHRDTNDNQEFDYVETEGEEDTPYLTFGDNPIVDDALITVE